MPIDRHQDAERAARIERMIEETRTKTRRDSRAGREDTWRVPAARELAAAHVDPAHRRKAAGTKSAQPGAGSFKGQVSTRFSREDATTALSGADAIARSSAKAKSLLAAH